MMIFAWLLVAALVSGEVYGTLLTIYRAVSRFMYKWGQSLFAISQALGKSYSLQLINQFIRKKIGSFVFVTGQHLSAHAQCLPINLEAGGSFPSRSA